MTFSPANSRPNTFAPNSGLILTFADLSLREKLCIVISLPATFLVSVESIPAVFKLSKLTVCQLKSCYDSDRDWV